MNTKVFSKTVVILYLVVTIVFHVNATEVRTVTVEPGDQRDLSIILDHGKKINGSLTIVTGDEIGFSVYDPHSSVVVPPSRVIKEASFEFVTEESGLYTLRFTNSHSSGTKNIQVSYDIQEYTPPPSIDFGTLLTAVGLIAVIIIIVVWWRFR